MTHRHEAENTPSAFDGRLRFLGADSKDWKVFVTFSSLVDGEYMIKRKRGMNKVPVVDNTHSSQA
jgi:hypothetical protein